MQDTLAGETGEGRETKRIARSFHFSIVVLTTFYSQQVFPCLLAQQYAEMALCSLGNDEHAQHSVYHCVMKHT